MSELSDHDKQLIADLHKRWISEELVGNSSKVLGYCTEGVMWMPPQSPPLLGKETIAQYLNENQVLLKDVKISNLSIKGNDTVAYLTSDYSSHFVAQGETTTQEADGTHLWVLEKTKDDLWLVAVVAWNLVSLKNIGGHEAASVTTG
jgi:ketosteroid isomerase-like protein